MKKKEKKLMGENYSSDRRKEGGSKFFYSIKFQNVVLNLLILLAFVLYVFTSIGALYKLKNYAVTTGNSQLECAREAYELKADVIHISAELNRYIGQAESGTVITTSDFAAMDSYISDIDSHLNYLDNCLLVSDLENGAQLVSTNRENVEVYLSAVDNIRSCILKGDVAGAIKYVFGDYGTYLDNINESMDALNDGVNDLQSGFVRFPYQEISPLLTATTSHFTRDVKVYYTPINLIHYSDIHSDKARAKNIAEFKQMYKNYIHGIIVTGDLCGSRYPDYDHLYDTEELQDHLLCIGNHDVYDHNGDAEAHGANYGDPAY